MDKRDLLGQLKIDREAEAAPDTGRPIKWFVAIAVVAGLAFVAWFVDLPGGGGDVLSVRTAVAATAGIPAPVRQPDR